MRDDSTGSPEQPKRRTLQGRQGRTSLRPKPQDEHLSEVPTLPQIYHQIIEPRPQPLTQRTKSVSLKTGAIRA